MNPIKVGLVGLGRAGWGMHMEELKGKEDMFQYVAFCDLIEDRLKAAAERFPGARTYLKIEDLLADEEVELVCIATRSCDHYLHAKMALKAGKDVLAEKPMAMTYAEAYDLKRLSEEDESCGHIYVRHNRRFEPNFIYVQNLIASGKLGRVYEIRHAVCSYSRRDDWQTISDFGGGQLLNWGPHLVDHSLRFLGGRVRKMSSFLDHTTAGGDCEDHVKILFEGENNMIVDMEISGGMALPVPEYLIYGTRGACSIMRNKAHLRYINPEQKLGPVVSSRETPQELSFGATNTFKAKVEIDWIEEDYDIPQEDLDHIWPYLYGAIREGKTFPISLEEAVQVIRVLEDVKKASRFKA